MNMRQDRDLAIKFDMIRRKLKDTGADLSKIPIVMEKGSTASYITKRIMSELKDGTQDSGDN